MASTPASPDSLPPLRELSADVPFWRYPSAALADTGHRPPARVADRGS
jgi:hypothetical protein